MHRTRLTGADGEPPRVEASFARRDALRTEPGDIVTHAIELLPTAMLVRRGHRLRLTLGGADLDHFDPPAAARTEWRIELGRSRLLVPHLPRT